MITECWVHAKRFLGKGFQKGSQKGFFFTEKQSEKGCQTGFLDVLCCLFGMFLFLLKREHILA